MTTITTISGNTSVSAARAIINANFENLNNEKADLSGANFASLLCDEI